MHGNKTRDILQPRTINNFLGSFLVFISGTQASSRPQRPDDGEHALIDDLLTGYGSTYARPVKQYNHSVDVYIYFVFLQVIEVVNDIKLLSTQNSILCLKSYYELHFNYILKTSNYVCVFLESSRTTSCVNINRYEVT